MSPLSRFMHTATAILDDPQRLAPNPHQPPVFVRTHWLFTEIDEANAKVSALTARIKEARLQTNVAEAARLALELVIITQQLAQLSVWVRQQFDREKP
jgi:hypothetical protein